MQRGAGLMGWLLLLLVLLTPVLLLGVLYAGEALERWLRRPLYNGKHEKRLDDWPPDNE